MVGFNVKADKCSTKYTRTVEGWTVGLKGKVYEEIVISHYGASWQVRGKRVHYDGRKSEQCLLKGEQAWSMVYARKLLNRNCQTEADAKAVCKKFLARQFE